MRTKLLKFKPNILDEAGPCGGSGDVCSLLTPSLPICECPRFKAYVSTSHRCSAILDPSDPFIRGKVFSDCCVSCCRCLITV